MGVGEWGGRGVTGGGHLAPWGVDSCRTGDLYWRAGAAAVTRCMLSHS